MQYPHYQGDCRHLQGYLELGGKYHSMCGHTLFALYFLLSPHDLKNLRVIKEHFMGKVMLGFMESNSNMAFAITDIVIWLFIFASKYMMHFTSLHFTVSETVVGKNILMKTAFGKFFVRRSFP